VGGTAAAGRYPSGVSGVDPAEGTTRPGPAGQRDSMPHHENHSVVRRRTGALAVAAGIAALAAACGGSPSSVAAAGSSTAAGGTSQAGGSAQSQQLAFARCMRSHGIADYPDSGPVQASAGSDLDPGNPTYRAAQQACQSLRPTEKLSPAQAAQNNAAALKYAECMRSHGITKYPDPQVGTGGNDTLNLTGIDLNSPQFQAAQQACRKYQVPNGKG